MQLYIIITSVNLSDSCLGWLYIFDNLLFIMIIVTVTVIVIIIIYELIALWLVRRVYHIIQTLFGSSAYLLDYKLSDNIYCVTCYCIYIEQIHCTCPQICNIELSCH